LVCCCVICMYRTCMLCQFVWFDVLVYGLFGVEVGEASFGLLVHCKQWDACIGDVQLLAIFCD